MNSTERAADPTANPPYWWLEDLLLNPSLLEPPPVVVPRLAWEGRVTLLAAREKVGKSTLMGQAVATLARAPKPFLGDDIEHAAPSLWLGLDEPLGDIVRRLHRYDAQLAGPLKVAIRTERPGVQEMHDLIHATGARLLVVDHLTEFVSGLVDDANNPLQIAPILKLLRQLAQETGVAIVVLHHSNKSTGDYRDSTQIGAGVDALVLLKEDDKDDAQRTARCRGRVVNCDFTLRYIGGVYEAVEGSVPINLQVQRLVTGQPGVSTRTVLSQIAGRSTTVLEVLAEIERAGLIENRGTEHKSAWFTCDMRRNGHP